MDREWSDRFLPVISQICGRVFLVPADEEEDLNFATDLRVIGGDNIRLAVRMRRHGYFHRYWNEFTVRLIRETGAKTELSKLETSNVSYYFYGHADSTNRKVEYWIILNLAVWRMSCCLFDTIGNENLVQPYFFDKNNGDGTWFRAYRISSFPDTLRVASNFEGLFTANLKEEAI